MEVDLEETKTYLFVHDQKHSSENCPTATHSVATGDSAYPLGEGSEGMATAGGDRYVGPIRKYFESRGISTSGVGAITIQKNRTSKFSSLVVDFDRDEILDLYPAEMLDRWVT